MLVMHPSFFIFKNLRIREFTSYLLVLVNFLFISSART